MVSLPPAYTKLLASQTLFPSIGTLGGPDAHHRWIITHAALTAAAPIVGPASPPWGLVQLQDENFRPFFGLNGAPILSGYPYQWQGRQVINAGALLNYQCTYENFWTVTVTGYELSVS